MSVRKLDAKGFAKWVDGLIKTQTVIGVRERDARYVFAPLAAASDLKLDYDVTVLPPKKFFLPAREDLLEFDRESVDYRTLLEAKPFVLFGVHPYDMVAIGQMDRLFSLDHRDEHYLARREQATLVVSDILSPSPNIFAGCMGTATLDDGYDVRVTLVGGCYLVEDKSDKGRALMAGLAQAPEADVCILGRREQLWEDNRKLLRKHDLNVPLQELPALLDKSYEHPVWAEKAQRCFSCGSCNLVCPTCYCFDVGEDVRWDLKGGTRSRTWDGCLLRDFALVAGGHNFRKDRADRYRHRYYRKGKYVAEKLGQISCVGCGRCVSACVAKIANPVEVYNRLLEVT